MNLPLYNFIATSHESSHLGQPQMLHCVREKLLSLPRTCQPAHDLTPMQFHMVHMALY